MILVMGMLPCADADECQDTVKVQQLTEPDGPQEAAHDDLCTPFCSCQCCDTHIAQIDLRNLAEYYYFEYNHPAISNLLADGVAIRVWDPPRSIC